MPGTLAVAFSCVAPRAVPCVMAAGVAQDTVGVVRGTLTTSVVEAVAVVYSVASVGVKVTPSVCVPAARTVPAAGA